MSLVGQNCRRGGVVLDSARIQSRRILDLGCEGCATGDVFVAGTIAFRPLDRAVQLDMLFPDLYFGVRVLLLGLCTATARLPRIPLTKLFIPFAPPRTPFAYRNERPGVR